jgi:hypothetical protein
MTLVKYGIAGVLVTSAALLACGSSSDDGGAGASSGGKSSGTAGAHAGSAGNKSSGGSTSASGGSTSSGQAGGTPVGSGGACGLTADPMSQVCPAGQTCIETKCKNEADAATSTSGACGSAIQCEDACNCDETCIGACAQSTECGTLRQDFATCVQSSCLTELLSCLGTGTGGTGASTKTCADLSTCCATLTDADEKANCTRVVSLQTELVCGLAYPNFCG